MQIKCRVIPGCALYESCGSLTLHIFPICSLLWSSDCSHHSIAERWSFTIITCSYKCDFGADDIYWSTMLFEESVTFHALRPWSIRTMQSVCSYAVAWGKMLLIDTVQWLCVIAVYSQRASSSKSLSHHLLRGVLITVGSCYNKARCRATYEWKCLTTEMTLHTKVNSKW